MVNESLAVYLNDHSAGAMAAIKLMEHLETQYTGTEVATFAAQLRADVEADERQLQTLIERLDISSNKTRKAAAWLTERVAQLKFIVDDSSGGPLRLLESLEMLALGIEGKLALWRSLHLVTPEVPELRRVDYDSLTQRAQEQRERVEPYRLAAARAALASAPA